MLSNKALLISLNISQWIGRKLDKRATGKVEESFATKGAVGNYTKKLLPDAKELEAVKNISGEARKYFYDNSLPWLSDGARIISSKHFFEVNSELRKRKQKFESAVNEFLSAYESLRVDAQLKLGSLFNNADYPPSHYLKDAFQFQVTVLPMPDVKDFRVEILDAEKDEFLARLKEVESAALKDCYRRLKEVVGNAASKLSNPKAVFRDSLIENISEICALLPKLDVNNDADLETTRKEVESIVSGLSAEVCRENQSERQKAASKLADIDSKMSALMKGI